MVPADCHINYMRTVCTIYHVLKVLSNDSRMRDRHYKSPYQFHPEPVPWYHTVAVFLVCHNMHNVDTSRSTTVCTVNSAGRRSIARARS